MKGEGEINQPSRIESQNIGLAFWQEKILIFESV